MAKSRKVAVVGAGAAGLTVTYRLSSLGHSVTVYESQPEPGGLASGFRWGGTRLDRFYRHLFTNDQAIIDLIHDLGLDSSLEWCQSSVGLYYRGTCYPFSTPKDLLTFQPLSIRDRFRLGVGFLRMRRTKDWRPLESLTAGDYIRRMMGEAAYRIVWEPLLRSKFGDAYQSVSAVWFWGKMQLRGGTRSKGGGKELLGYLRGGFCVLFDRLADRCRDQGVEILFRTPVRQVRPAPNDRVEVVTDQGEHTFDDVVVTASPRVLLDMTPCLPSQYRDALSQIQYQGSVVVILPLQESISPVYWLNVNDPSVPFVAVIDQRRFFDDPEYGDRYPIYLSRYLSPSDPLYRTPPGDLVPLFVKHLSQMFPAANLKPTLKGFLFREPDTQPVITCRYSNALPPFHTPVAGLHLVCMAQIYPADRGMNYSVEIGNRFVNEWQNRTELS